MPPKSRQWSTNNAPTPKTVVWKKPKTPYHLGVENGKLLGALAWEPRATSRKRLLTQTEDNIYIALPEEKKKKKNLQRKTPLLRLKNMSNTTREPQTSPLRSKNTININTTRVTNTRLRAEAAKRLSRALGKSVTAMHARQGWAIDVNGMRAINSVTKEPLMRRNGVVMPDGIPRWVNRNTIAGMKESGRTLQGPLTREPWKNIIQRRDAHAYYKSTSLMKNTPRFRKFLAILSNEHMNVSMGQYTLATDVLVKAKLFQYTYIAPGLAYDEEMDGIYMYPRLRLEYPVVATFLHLRKDNGYVDHLKIDVLQIFKSVNNAHEKCTYGILVTSYYDEPEFPMGNYFKIKNRMSVTAVRNALRSRFHDGLVLYELIPAVKQIHDIRSELEINRWKPERKRKPPTVQRPKQPLYS